MTIILDLDDVLANLRQTLYQVMHQATGIDKHWREWDHYDLTQHFAVDNQTLEDILMNEQALERCQPEPQAVAATQQLCTLGFELAIITARGWHARAYELTADWLQQHGIQYHGLTIVPLGSNKLEVLGPYRDIVLAVDDHPNNIKRYQQANIPSLMVDMPWNANHDAERIYSLQTLVDHAEVIVEAAKPKSIK